MKTTSDHTVIMHQSPLTKDQLEKITTLIEQSNIFATGYIPPDIGAYHPDGFIYAMEIEKNEFTIIPDRNIFTRIIRTYSGHSITTQSRVASAMMAFSQLLGIIIDPALPLYEVASTQRNDIAVSELQIFRDADNADILKWTNAALYGKRFPMQQLSFHNKYVDFSTPLERWNTNYAAALKIGELELLDISPLKKLEKLYLWMFEDFFIAGPAAILAAFYFAPNSPRKNCFKHLRSQDRKRALLGIKNMAWDITYVSEFTKTVHENIHSRNRFIFASFDNALKTLANMCVNNQSSCSTIHFIVPLLQKWWPKRQAEYIADTLEKMLTDSDNSARRVNDISRIHPLEQIISHGEMAILGWSNN